MDGSEDAPGGVARSRLRRGRGALAIWRTSLGMGSPANVLAVSCLPIANVKNPLTFPQQRGIRRNRFARGCVWLMKT